MSNYIPNHNPNLYAIIETRGNERNIIDAHPIIGFREEQGSNGFYLPVVPFSNVDNPNSTVWVYDTETGVMNSHEGESICIKDFYASLDSKYNDLQIHERCLLYTSPSPRD